MINAVNHDNHNLQAFSAAATGGNTADQKNPGCRGVKVVIDITAIGTTPSLVVTIKFKDPVSGKYLTVLASAAITTVSTVTLTVFPGAPASANVSANDQLPATWRIEWTLSGGTVTGTIGASYLV